MNDEKNKKKIKIVVTSVIILILLVFLVLKPLIDFKKNEKNVLNAGKRYYELNKSELPTGTKVKTVSLKTLYEKQYIEIKDIKVPNSKATCSLDNSWVKITKSNNEYQYYTYLECGIFHSKVDHEGPNITLKGKEEITIYQNKKFKDPGISNVVDNKDGKIDVKQVKIETNVDTSKVGTYHITYTVKDKFQNETKKIRTVNVIQTLNNIVKTNTDNTNLYKGSQENNYIRIDGINFRIVGINSNDTVKIVTNNAMGAVNYNSINEWLNEYFYEKLSDSAKKLIDPKSKWCEQEFNEANGITKCDNISKKRKVGTLSIVDVNNAKGEDGTYPFLVEEGTWFANAKDSKTAWSYSRVEYKVSNKTENNTVRPVLNIIKNTSVIGGTGYANDPYILEGNKQKLKAGTKISEARAGDYISYSGYLWRVIEEENDATTKVIMNDVLNINGESYQVAFNSKQKMTYNPEQKGNVLYSLTNNGSNYVKTGIFQSKSKKYLKYEKNIKYNKSINSKEYKLKLHLPSIYELFSTSVDKDYWYSDISDSKFCYMNFRGEVSCEKYNYNTISGFRPIGYIKKDIKIKSGNGTEGEPYVLAS